MSLLFVDVAYQAGILWNGENGSITINWVDYNKDNLPDLWTGPHGYSSTSRPKLFVNQGNGTFIDRAPNIFNLSEFTRDTHGTPWGDFDNDGDPDLFITTGAQNGTGGVPKFLFLNDNGIFKIQDNARGANLPTARSRNAIWLDWNNDGKLDLLYLNEIIHSTDPVNTLFEQTNNGFINVNETANFNVPTNTISAQLIDLYNNGKQDLMIFADNNHPVKIYETGGTQLKDISDQMPFVAEIRDAAIADFNNDLVPDIFYVRSRIADVDDDQTPELDSAVIRESNFKQYGDKKLFARLSLLDGSQEVGISFNTDNNVDFDLFKNPAKPALPASMIYIGAQGINPSKNKFTLSPTNSSVVGIQSLEERNNKAGLYIGYSLETNNWQAIFSAGNNQLLKPSDLIINTVNSISNVQPINFTNGDFDTQGAIAPVLLVYDPQTGTYIDQTSSSGLDTAIDGRSVVSGDFDNDMDIDLYISSTTFFSTLPSVYYENQGNGTFIAVPNSAGALINQIGPRQEHFNVGLNVAVADYDVDGFLDIAVGSSAILGTQANYVGSPYYLFHNQRNNNKWLEINLKGTNVNLDGIGTKVFVTAGGKTQLREQTGGAHRIGQNSRIIHFGLGQGNKVSKLEVVWSNYQIQRLYNVSANQLMTIVEPELSSNNLFVGSDKEDSINALGGNDTIEGKGGDDQLIGGNGNDQLIGGNGNDQLIGGSGKNILTGGNGNDIFSFVSPLGVTDQIKDFVLSNDVIEISASGFNLNTNIGQLAAEMFVVGRKALTSGQVFIYDNSNGSLWFDQDGSGLIQQKLLAKFTSPLPNLTNSNIFLV